MHAMRMVAAAALMAVASTASAQITPPPNYWAHGTELAVVAGSATSASTTGAMVAARAAWEITRWISVDGRGSWFDRGHDASAFAADLSGIVNLVAKRQVTPFVGGGFGFYRASFTGPMNATSGMPSVYQSRMMAQSIGASRVFTDPAFTTTAGIDMITKRHWTVRPEVTARFVRSDGMGTTMLTAGVSVGYRFEDHAVTP